MRITDLLDKNSINLNASPQNKKEALDQAVELMARSGKINDVEAYRKQVYAREEESTTGVGEGIAIPHGKCSAVNAPGLSAMVIKDGVDFDSLDGEPVNILFLIAAPDTEDNVHMDVLSKLSVLLMDEEFVDSLKKARDVDEFLSLIDKADKEKIIALLNNHIKYTGSKKAKYILANIESEISNFKTIIPVKYREMLKTIKKFEAMGMKEEEAKLEAFEYMKGAK